MIETTTYLFLSISLNKETISVLTKHASKFQLMEISRQQLIFSYISLDKVTISVLTKHVTFIFDKITVSVLTKHVTCI